MMGEVAVNCYNCQVSFEKKRSEVSERNFCSRSCSAIYNNRNRLLDPGRKKMFLCGSCGEESFFPANAVAVCRNAACKSYVPDWRTNRKKRGKAKKKLECCLCGGEFWGGRGKYCLGCIGNARKAAAQKSVEKQGRRSRNEILFAELCLKELGKVECNRAIFFGWDADVILHDWKIAVLWNGNWHYVPIHKDRSLEQIQNRDKLKIDAIRRFGYLPYVVEDRGRYNRKFVMKQFEKLKEFLMEK